MEFTNEEINRQYTVTLDNVTVVNTLAAKADRTDDEDQFLVTNYKHITHMLQKNFWLPENDLTVFTECLAQAASVVSGVDNTIKELTLDELKLQKQATLKHQREVLSNEPLDGFDVGELQDRENLQGAIQHFTTLAQGGDTIVWTMANGLEEAVTLTRLQGVVDGYVLRKAQVFAQYQALKAQVNNATTQKQLAAIPPELTV